MNQNFKLTWPLAVALLAGVAVNSWLTLPSWGRSVPPGAVRNDGLHLAFSIPPGWDMVTAGDFDALTAEYPYPQQVMRLLRREIKTLGLIRKDTPGNVPAFVDIAVLEGSIKGDPVEDRKRNLISYPLQEGNRRQSEEQAFEAAELDGMAAARIRRSFMLRTASGASGNPNKLDSESLIKVTQYAVRHPERGKMFLIAFIAPEEGFEDSSRGFDALLASFRITERPPRVGSIIGRALYGGLATGGVYVLLILFLKLWTAAGKG